MSSTIWIPSITISLLLTGSYILLLSGIQTTTWPKKTVRLGLTLIATYLLLPLILNSAQWAMHGPSPPPNLTPTSPREEITGQRYCELARDPQLSTEKFLERLSPFLRTAPIATPQKNTLLVRAWGVPATPKSPLWELHPPAGFSLLHAEELLRDLHKKTDAEKERRLLFLLQLGNQLTSLPFPETYETGRDILRKTLIYCTQNQSLLRTPEILEELRQLQTLPRKLQETLQRDKQRRLLHAESEIWSEGKNLSLKSLLIERNTLLATQEGLSDSEKMELGQRLLLQGQLYHYHLLHRPPPKPPLQKSTEDSLSRLASLLAEKLATKTNNPPPPSALTDLEKQRDSPYEPTQTGKPRNSQHPP